jgi:hypothetical protein
MSGVSDPQMKGNHNRGQKYKFYSFGVSDPQMKGNHN